MSTILNDGTMEDIFDEGGVLCQKLKGYEFRPGQLELARLALRAYQENRIAVLEAGTGIGKSFAYLAVAMLNAAATSGERTVISTATINLQKQLVDKDIPMLRQMLGLENIRTALVVGRSNYMCINRFRKYIAENNLFASDTTSEVGKLKKWGHETQTGLYNDCPPLSAGVWSEINSDGDLCMGFQCPYRNECFFQKSRKEAISSRIIVCNHHLLFADSQYRAEGDIEYCEDGVLPGFSRLVIDEAHNIEPIATEFFSYTFNAHDVIRNLGRLTKAKNSRKKDLLSRIGEYFDDRNMLAIIQDYAADVENRTTALREYLLAKFGSNGYKSVLIRPQQQAKLSQFRDASMSLLESSERFVTKFQAACASAKVPDEMQSELNEANVLVTRIKNEMNSLFKFCDFDKWGDDIYWFDAESSIKRKSIVPTISPLNVSEAIVQNLFLKLETVICTSATLDLHDDFAYYLRTIGLDNEEIPILRDSFESPFDYRNNLLLLTPADSPLVPKRDDVDAEARYYHDIAEIVYDSMISSSGGALVLFTSKVAMNTVYELLKDRFAFADLKVFTQFDGDRTKVLKNFIEDSDSSLFALSSFWEGVDAPGHTLRLVIIPKLPFQVPTDPVLKARGEYLERNGGSQFAQLSLPYATMKLKQGFGRLMRNTFDSGVVLILDQRIVSKSYGKYMLRALPESFHPDSMISTIGEKIENFCFRS